MRCFTAIVLFALLFISTRVFAQQPRKFARHDIVEVGNGRKAEIIQCRGEGPLEECDVIYYTTNRARGERVWQNANRLREEERAARLLRDIRAGKVNSLSKTSPAAAKPLEVERVKLAAEQLVSEPPPVRGSKLIDSSAVGSNVSKDATLKKVVRRIDSVTKARVDTFQIALKRALALQDSLANAAAGKNAADSLPASQNNAVDFSTADDVEADEAVNAVQVQPATPAPSPKSGSPVAAPAASVESKQTNATASPATTAVKTITVEVLAAGKWQKGTIMNAEGEYLYQVHIPGTTDEWYTRSQVRNFDTTSERAPLVKATQPRTENCNFTAPPAIKEAANFSNQVARRKIYELYNSNASGRVALSFIALVHETPYINSVSVSAGSQMVYRYPAAPAGAMIYPLNARFVLCEEQQKQVSSKRLNAHFSCFRNKEGVWACANDQ